MYFKCKYINTSMYFKYLVFQILPSTVSCFSMYITAAVCVRVSCFSLYFTAAACVCHEFSCILQQQCVSCFSMYFIAAVCVMLSHVFYSSSSVCAVSYTHLT